MVGTFGGRVLLMFAFSLAGGMGLACVSVLMGPRLHMDGTTHWGKPCPYLIRSCPHHSDGSWRLAPGAGRWFLCDSVCFALVIAPLSAIWMGFKVFRLRRSEHGLCVQCGYNLRGLPEARCLECGLPFASVAVEPPAPLTSAADVGENKTR